MHVAWTFDGEDFNCGASAATRYRYAMRITFASVLSVYPKGTSTLGYVWEHRGRPVVTAATNMHTILGHVDVTNDYCR